RLLRRLPASLDPVVRIEHMDYAGHAGLGRPTARIARQGDAAAGRAVVRPIARKNLLAAGVQPRHPDGVLVRLGASVGEEEDVDVAGRDRCEPGAEAGPRLSRHERVRIGEHGCLLLDGAYDALVAVTDVHAHQLAVEDRKSTRLNS